MNIKLPSIAPPIKDITVGKETQKINLAEIIKIINKQKAKN